MGKGDKKTKKGKIWRNTHGVRRPKKGKSEEAHIRKKENAKEK